MATLLTGYRERNYINDMLAQQLLALSEKTELTFNMLLNCRQYLQERVSNQPRPPENWCKQMPSTTSHVKQWKQLKFFLESPDEVVFDYRKNQFERNEMQNAISDVVIDLRTETIRKGSPHTLRITKTQEAYNLELRKWKEDIVLLDKVIKKIET